MPVRSCIIVLIALLAFCLTPALAAPATPAETTPLLVWVDAENGSTIFTIHDIVRFDWDRQMLELTPERATALLALPIVQRKEFAVKDREGVIYRGRFYRSSSTGGEGYDGSTILVDQGPLKQLPASPFFVISGGYPTGGGTHERDRFSSRVRTALEQAGVLATISDTELPVKRLWSGHTWVGGEQVLKASAVLFPETFHIGQTAYLHLLLYKGQKPDFAFDQLVVEAVCTGDNGRFSSRHTVYTITPPLLDNGIYVCAFQPWDGTLLPTADGAIRPAALKSGATPRYPKDALNDKDEGTVLVALTVTANGKVEKVTLLASSKKSDLDKSVLRTVNKWVFIPAMHGDEAVDSVVKVQFTFANGKVESTMLPPEPVKMTAAPGMIELTINITAMKMTDGHLVPTGTWTVPARQVELLSPAPTQN